MVDHNGILPVAFELKYHLLSLLLYDDLFISFLRSNHSERISVCFSINSVDLLIISNN